MSRIYRRGGRWYCDLRDGAGFRSRVACGPKRADAQRCLDEFAARLRLGGSADESVIRVGDLLLAYCERQEGREKAGDLSRSAVENVRFALKHLLPVFESMIVADLRPGDWEKYTQGRLTEGAAPGTIKHEHRCLRGALLAAKREGKIGRDPLDGVKVGVRARRVVERRSPSRDELARILEAAPAPWRRLFTFLSGTGLRPAEALSRTWGDVTLDAVPPAVTIGKTKSEAGRRTIPLAPDVIAALGEPGAREARLFPVSCGGALKAFHRAVAASGVNPDLLTLYSLRDYFASRYLEDGGTPAELKYLMGHRTAAMALEHYAHADPARCYAVVSGLLPVAGTNRAQRPVRPTSEAG